MNRRFQEAESTLDQYKVKKVEFGLLKPQEIVSPRRPSHPRQKTLSVCEVNNDKIYEQETKAPSEGGINDRRMGVIEPRTQCATCQGGTCPHPKHTK